MPYDPGLAERIREDLAANPNVVEKKMFGGVGFLLCGNMCVGVWNENLIVRVGGDAYEQALADEFTQEFDITGKSMKGWVMVEPAGIEEDSQLSDWIARAVEFVETLPAK